MTATETPWKLCELCNTEPVEHGRICETCKSLPEKITVNETKRCNKCGEFKELEQFDNDKHSKDGKTGTCKQCRSLRDKEAHKRKIAKKYLGFTRMHPPEQQPDHYPTVLDTGNVNYPPSLDKLDEKYQVTVDFSGCKWLLAYLESASSLPVSLQIKRALIERMTDAELRSWLLTEIVS